MAHARQEAALETLRLLELGVGRGQQLRLRGHVLLLVQQLLEDLGVAQRHGNADQNRTHQPGLALDVRPLRVLTQLQRADHLLLGDQRDRGHGAGLPAHLLDLPTVDVVRELLRTVVKLPRGVSHPLAGPTCLHGQDDHFGAGELPDDVEQTAGDLIDVESGADHEGEVGDPFALVQHPPNLLAHLPEALRQAAELIARVDVDRRREIALGELLDRRGQR